MADMDELKLKGFYGCWAIVRHILSEDVDLMYFDHRDGPVEGSKVSEILRGPHWLVIHIFSEDIQDFIENFLGEESVLCTDLAEGERRRKIIIGIAQAGKKLV